MNCPAIWMTASLACRQEIDIFMQLDDENLKPSVYYLMFVTEIHTLHTYFGIKLIERILIAHNIAAKNMLSIEHIKRLFRALHKRPGH